MGENYNQKDIAPTLAEILEINYDIADGRKIKINPEYKGEKLIFAIIDSLDWSVYERFAKRFIKEVFEVPVREFKVKSMAKNTSPAIATILTGLDPSKHGVFSTKDAQESEILNLAEFSAEKGVKTTVIMESRGANTFLRTLNQVTAIEDESNIQEFDKKILSGVEKAIEDFEFIICHLRTLDEYFHQSKSFTEIKNSVKRILGNLIRIGKEGNFLLVITGDHRAHGDLIEGSELVPLLFIDLRT